MKLDTVTAARWVAASLRSARPELRLHGLRAAVPSPPAGLRPAAVRGVNWALRRSKATCLERALVLQQWDAAHGRRRAVIVGTSSEPGAFQAHAWLEGEDAGGHVELTRVELHS